MFGHAGAVLPLEVNARELVDGPIFGDTGVMFLENTEEVLRMMITNIFDTEVIDDEDELNRAPLVTPDTRSGGSLIVVMFIEAFVEEIVGKFSGLREAVDIFAYFEVNPTITNVFGEDVFINKFLGNVGEFDSDVLWAVERIFEVKIGDVEAGKLGAWERQDTVEYQIEKFQRGSVGANISWLADVVATDRNAGVVGVGFLRADKTDELGVGDFLAMIHGDVFVVDNV